VFSLNACINCAKNNMKNGVRNKLKEICENSNIFIDQQVIYENVNNKIKFKSASLFFRNYKILTEKEVPYLPKESIDLLISDGKILLDEKSIKKLERYKH
jgi:uncharacterized protein YaaR (DUF327 family)